jgi:hypothetical protein
VLLLFLPIYPRKFAQGHHCNQQCSVFSKPCVDAGFQPFLDIKQGATGFIKMFNNNYSLQKY